MFCVKFFFVNECVLLFLNNMTNKTQIIIKSIVVVCFSVVVLAIFRFYSMLRPTTYGALYKELYAGGIVLLICYLNYFILFPHLFGRRKYLFYVLATIFSVIVAATLEVMLVYPQIMDFFNRINSNVSIREYIIVLTISLFLRNICFVFFSFLINLLESAYKENKDVVVLLQDTNELMLARTDDKKRNLVTVRLPDIAYCRQNENYAYIYLADGTKVYRNCSLKSLYEQLSPSRVVRISRKELVFYRHIVSYDNNSVYVDASNEDAPVGLEITDTYRRQALLLLKEHCVFAGNQQSRHVPEVTTVDVLQSAYTPQQTEKDAVQEKNLSEEEPRVAQQVLAFISEHPSCKSSDLTGQFRISLSTVNRILRQLKADGLIEYVGSKKTGGYSAVGKGEM